MSARGGERLGTGLRAEVRSLDAATAALRPGGTTSVVGFFLGNVPVNPTALFLKEGTLTWSNCYDHPHDGADFQTAVDLVSRHRELLASLVTEVVPLDEVQRAFAAASDKKTGAIKISVVP